MTISGALLDRFLAPGSADVLDLAIRATIVLGAALGLARALRWGAARTRHALWTATFAVLLVLPAAATWAPGWEVAVLPSGPTSEADAAARIAVDVAGEARAGRAIDRISGAAAAGTARGAGPSLGTGGDATDGAAAARLSPRPGAAGGDGRWGVSAAGIAAALWGAGAGLGLISLFVGHLRFRRLAATGRHVDDPVWLGRIDRLRARLGIDRPVRLVVHDEATTPMTGGILDPVVVLPAVSQCWTPERREVVLTHELVHVRRRDPLRQALARAALAFYWFHPLGWVAARRASMSREQSCDEEVLALGVRPSEYASVLVDLAGGVRPAPAALAISMIQPSDLERRVMSILDPNRPRRSAFASAGALLMIGAVGIPAAIAQPVPAPPPLPVLVPPSEPPVALLPEPPVALLPEPPVAPLSARAVVPRSQPPAAPPLVPPPTVSVEALEQAPPGVSVREPHPTRVPPLPSVPDVARPALALPEPAPPPSAGGVRALPIPPAPQDPTCRVEGVRGSFSGNLSFHGHRRELSGTHDGDRIIQVYVEDLRLCVRTHGDVEMSEDHDEVLSIGSGGWVVLESEEEHFHRLVITGAGTGFDYDWYVDGRAAEFDAQAREWKDRVLAVLAGRWEISSIRGEVAALRGTIAGYRGEVASMRGEIAGHRGHIAGLRGGISSERGRLAEMNGEIADLRGRIARLHAQIRRASDDDTRRRLMTLSEEIERAISAVRESEEAARANRRIAELEAEIEEHGLAGEIGEVEARLADYDLDRRVAEVQRQIEAIDADRRVAEIERRLEPQIDALRRLLERI